MSPATRRRMRNRIGRGLTFEKVWATIEKNAQEAEKRYAEWEAKWQKEAEERKKQAAEREAQRQKEAEERKKQAAEWKEKREQEQKEYDERQRKLDRNMESLNEQMGGLHNSFGEMAEYMVAPGIVDLFNDLGFHITQAAIHGMRILDEKKRLRAQIDLFMGNGDYIIAVEVKTSLGEKDIEKHRKRLEILREHHNKIGDRRKIRGGMAVAILSEDDRKMILDAGFYLLEPSGDMMKMDLPESFVPSEW
jgi:hypothetical protein